MVTLHYPLKEGALWGAVTGALAGYLVAMVSASMYWVMGWVMGTFVLYALAQIMVMALLGALLGGMVGVASGVFLWFVANMVMGVRAVKTFAASVSSLERGTVLGALIGAMGGLADGMVILLLGDAFSVAMATAVVWFVGGACAGATIAWCRQMPWWTEWWAMVMGMVVMFSFGAVGGAFFGATDTATKESVVALIRETIGVLPYKGLSLVIEENILIASMGIMFWTVMASMAALIFGVLFGRIISIMIVYGGPRKT